MTVVFILSTDEKNSVKLWIVVMGGSIVCVININICDCNYSIDDTTVGLKRLWYISAVSCTAGSPALRFVVNNVERNSKIRNRAITITILLDRLVPEI
jgi:hypothetical protein